MGTSPKKRFSQNFLADKNIAARIVDLIEAGPNDTVLEIGSGRGTLTELLAETGANVISFEIDRQLIANLDRQFGDNPGVRIVNLDFLEVDPSDYCDGEFRLIGNIPYDITSPLLDWIVRYREKITRAVITTQKELGDRISSGPGSKNWAPISIFTQCHFDIKSEITIPPKAFYPPPRVDSSTLTLTPIRRYEFDDWANFEEVVRAGFKHRRKQLAKNLGEMEEIEKKEVIKILNNSGIASDIRAEALSIEQFVDLAEKIKKSKSC